ncbi:MAG: SRPBCC family protein [Gemmatimonadota bacterium]|uniref:SRPBCC family protein n=1 Tax=Candidatus Palauibacter soopunensis TaxID=3056739 RepID=UPI00238B9C4A|nr:SRPBCC family protein [Candidatus Palauibacter soopunensis]MDE2878744.1 SRPBCC family protein [Candidatus Palauibacter soopunensis]MDE2945147.1 SRPBCC family protein [Gemmatimonadota bacterium]
MAIEIEKSFDVPQSVDEVWSFLTDPERIVECLPGATLLEAVDERTYRGEIGLKLGPIGTRFLGEIRFDELDARRHHMKMTGEGRDRRGSGNVRMTMLSQLRSVEEEGVGGTRIWVSQSIALTGRLASFGRGGVIQSVSNVMFNRFTGCVREKLAQ